VNAGEWIAIGALLLSAVVAFFTVRAQRRQHELEQQAEAERQEKAGE
jgi:hypothetical protein